MLWVRQLASNHESELNWTKQKHGLERQINLRHTVKSDWKQFHRVEEADSFPDWIHSQERLPMLASKMCYQLARFLDEFCNPCARFCNSDCVPATCTKSINHINRTTRMKRETSPYFKTLSILEMFSSWHCRGIRGGVSCRVAQVWPIGCGLAMTDSWISHAETGGTGRR